MGLCMQGRNLLSEAKAKSVIEFTDSMIADGRSVVIVAGFSNTLDILKEHYKDNISIIRGGMSDKKKQKAIDDFQSGKNTICAMNIIADGVGVTLTKAHDMIMVDYDWTPSNMKQAEDRIVRTGQTENLCNIYYMYCQHSALDEYFTGMLSEKSSNIDSVIDNDDNSLNLLKGLMEMKGLTKGINDKQIDTEIKTFIEDEMKKELGEDTLVPNISPNSPVSESNDSMDEINYGLEEMEL